MSITVVRMCAFIVCLVKVFMPHRLSGIRFYELKATLKHVYFTGIKFSQFE